MKCGSPKQTFTFVNKEYMELRVSDHLRNFFRSIRRSNSQPCLSSYSMALSRFESGNSSFQRSQEQRGLHRLLTIICDRRSVGIHVKHRMGEAPAPLYLNSSILEVPAEMGFDCGCISLNIGYEAAIVWLRKIRSE